MINKLIKSNVIFPYIYKTQFQTKSTRLKCPFFFLFGYAMFGLSPHRMLRLPTRVERCFVMILVVQFNFTFVLVILYFCFGSQQTVMTSNLDGSICSLHIKLLDYTTSIIINQSFCRLNYYLYQNIFLSLVCVCFSTKYINIYIYIIN